MVTNTNLKIKDLITILIEIDNSSKMEDNNNNNIIDKTKIMVNSLKIKKNPLFNINKKKVLTSNISPKVILKNNLVVEFNMF
jgi:hypothetical protein